MKTVNLATLDLMEGWFADDQTARHRGTFPLCGGNGTEQLAVVYVELAAGQRLHEHTDSPEELLVILEGDVEVTVGDEQARAAAGSLAVVPPMAPHSIRNVGEGIARFCGIFPSPAVVSTFVTPMLPIGERTLEWGVFPAREPALA